MDNTPRSSQTKIVVAAGCFVAAIALSFFAGVYMGFKNRPAVSKVTDLFNKEQGMPAGVDFAPFWRAWNIINEKYVASGGPTNQEKVWGAIAGLASSLDDPYTLFFTPEDLGIFEESISGNFEGVGMEVGVRDDTLTVIAPLKGTPAERAGILSGDKILNINGTSTINLEIDEAVRLIRGERGTEVVLTVLHEKAKEPLTITVVRDVITVPTIATELKHTSGTGSGGDSGTGLRKDGVFVVRLFTFAANAPGEFRDALREFVVSGSDKLVIDLRGNPGGFLEAAVDMASWFLPAGKVVVREEFAKGEAGTIYRSKGYDIFKDKPINVVVLVNEGSASASEILAGALREHDIATLVGQKTFGKGSVQELIDVTDDTALKVTVARWLTPNGNSISEGGLEPDVSVERTPEDLEAERDPQLDKAIEILLKK